MSIHDAICYVKVAEDPDNQIELPTEENGALLLSTIQAQFPKCTGLQFKVPETGAIRGLRLFNEHIFPPQGGWGDSVYSCVFPKDVKRKISENGTETSSKKSRLEVSRPCTDLVVLNLSWRADEDSLKKYFSQFGDVMMVQVKRDGRNKQSRGYGFVRFDKYESQALCLAELHKIDGRRCEVRIPNSKIDGDRQEVFRKVHVSNITDSTTAKSLIEFFSTFGKVKDVYIPSPFRSFAFVTFEDASVAANLIGKQLTLDGHTVVIGTAVPKVPPSRFDRERFRAPRNEYGGSYLDRFEPNCDAFSDGRRGENCDAFSYGRRVENSYNGRYL